VVPGLIFQMALGGGVDILGLSVLFAKKESEGDECCRKDSFGDLSRVLEKSDKTGGFGGIVVRKQDFFVPKRSKIAGFRKDAKAI
ncbi:12045_t:CDS:2, partial [Gigaspora rosea]